MGDSHRGNKSSTWKGGITPQNHIIRNNIEIKLWRKACMERDNYTCQKYGTRGGELRIHHINNFAEFPELRTSIENGITLSKKAHDEFHKKYGFKNNTKEQLLEFLNK
jgi:5-methylcytosine-specific restriction endonuclease McrA